MECTTIRAEAENPQCPFMSKKGCSYNGGSCNQIVEDCAGCSRTIKVGGKEYCLSIPDPISKWRGGVCNFATHITREKAIETVTKLNPLKASKRGIR